jgi:hypothetical protein
MWCQTSPSGASMTADSQTEVLVGILDACPQRCGGSVVGGVWGVSPVVCHMGRDWGQRPTPEGGGLAGRLDRAPTPDVVVPCHRPIDCDPPWALTGPRISRGVSRRVAKIRDVGCFTGARFRAPDRIHPDMAKSRECLDSRCSRAPGYQGEVCVYRVSFVPFRRGGAASSHP